MGVVHVPCTLKKREDLRCLLVDVVKSYPVPVIRQSMDLLHDFCIYS